MDSDIQIRSRPLSCTLAKIFGSVYFASWGKSYGCLAFSQTRLVEVVTWQVLQPVAQLYGQVRTDWNQCFVIDCSLSHPAGHKPFTCSHSVLRNTWLNIHAVRSMRFSAHLSVHVFTISRNLTWSLFVSSALSELSSAWSIICLLRYVCCCIVVKDKEAVCVNGR